MNSTQMNRDGNRILENGRLVYYKQTANREYWESVWLQYSAPDYYTPFRQGKLFDFEKIFKRHLPKKGKILEAGCGTAQLVLALNANGYNCMGLDYASDALGVAQRMAGPLKLVSGDLTKLGVSNDAFDAIISIGVVEHRYAGPEPFLNEMSRILKTGGVMLISVPFFNPLRRWRSRHGAYRDNITGLDFYQYAFTKEDFCRIIETAGYKIESTYSYSHQKTLSEELSWLKKLPAPLTKFIMRLSKHIPYVNSEIGHMLMIVARKK